MQIQPRTTAARAQRLVTVLALAAIFGGIGFHWADAPAKQDVQVLGQQIRGSGSTPPGKGKGLEKRNFLIDGDAQDLYPTIETTLDLTITNPNNFPIRVTSLTVTVGDASGDCSSEYVGVTGFTGGPALIVPENGTAPKSLPLTMSADAPDECQGAVFPMTYEGK